MPTERRRWFVIVAIVAMAIAIAPWPTSLQKCDAQNAQAAIHRDDAAKPDEAPAPSDAPAALRLGLPIIQQAAANYPKHRKCFSCHHQTLPMLAIVAARDAGVEVDGKLLEAQADFTNKSFHDLVEPMREGKGVGGRALTVGYGLWALGIAGRPASETTEAMVTYLLKTQQEDGHWNVQTVRPPQEESFITCTVLAVAGMKRYATTAQGADVGAAINKAKAWLAKTKPQSQEDRAMALWGSAQFGATPDELRASLYSVIYLR